jgi:hypothetical protein
VTVRATTPADHTTTASSRTTATMVNHQAVHRHPTRNRAATVMRVCRRRRIARRGRPLRVVRRSPLRTPRRRATATSDHTVRHPPTVARTVGPPGPRTLATPRMARTLPIRAVPGRKTLRYSRIRSRTATPGPNPNSNRTRTVNNPATPNRPVPPRTRLAHDPMAQPLSTPRRHKTPRRLPTTRRRSNIRLRR